MKEIVERAANVIQTEAERASDPERVSKEKDPEDDVVRTDTSVIIYPPRRAISTTPQIKTGLPTGQSTALPPIELRSTPRFPSLKHIQEEREESHNSTLQFTQPPADALTLFMSMLGQHLPLNEYVDPVDLGHPTIVKREM